MYSFQGHVFLMLCFDDMPWCSFSLWVHPRTTCGSDRRFQGVPQNLSQFYKQFEPPRGITNNVVSEQVGHKAGCTVTEAG